MIQWVVVTTDPYKLFILHRGSAQFIHNLSIWAGLSLRKPQHCRVEEKNQFENIQQIKNWCCFPSLNKHHREYFVGCYSVKTAEQKHSVLFFFFISAVYRVHFSGWLSSLLLPLCDKIKLFFIFLLSVCVHVGILSWPVSDAPSCSSLD